jgi:hypothetical protein
VFSILHISDLHRSPRDSITNAELISALISDRQRYAQEEPAIRAPDAIVVSGDIIQGVPLGTAEATEELAKQYSTAAAFLAELTERFLGGDRSRVVIVPGNHDIDWVMSRAAMSLVAHDQVPQDLPSELHRVDTPYRWSWKTRELFQVSDCALYEQRMDAYWRFFDDFYHSVRGLLKVIRGQPAQLYSLWDARIGVAAFNSCQGNDCFAVHGSIPRDAVAQAHLDLIDEGEFELLIAVWHHSVEGPPYQMDYMDLDIVRGMIGRGFRLGLYGHHHRAEAVPLQIHLAGRETMALVSAGSLCAGARELPTGNYRGYNVIEISDSMRQARVHMREMSVANLFCPSRRAAFGGASWVDLQWDPPADLAGRLVRSAERRVAEALLRAEADLKAGLPQAAKELLQSLGPDLPNFGRLLLLEAGRQTGDLPLLLHLLTPPGSIAELIELSEICVRAKDFAGARDYLEKFAGALAVTEPHLQELRSRIAAAEAISL